MGAPLAWLGASPVLVYNLVLLAGFTLTGWVTCLVLARWTGDWTAGLIAGVLNGVVGVIEHRAHGANALLHSVTHHLLEPVSRNDLDVVVQETQQ